MEKNGDQIEIRAKPFHALIESRSLDFTPPYAEVSKNPAGFVFWWRLLQYVYELPNPAEFPAFSAPTPFTAEEVRILDRYLLTCQELAHSSVISHPGGIRVRLSGPNAEPEVEANFPSNELIRGTTVLFRQVSSPGEPASYISVRRILGHHAHAVNDANRERRLAEQRVWNRAHGGLQAGLLIVQADRRASDEHGYNIPLGELPGEDARPQQLISMFQYGDLIHWGRHSEDMEALMKDEFWHKWTTLQFIETLVQLSHFYLGYSLLVRRALGRA